MRKTIALAVIVELLSDPDFADVWHKKSRRTQDYIQRRITDAIGRVIDEAPPALPTQPLEVPA